MMISVYKKTFYGRFKYIGEHAGAYSFYAHLHDLFEFIYLIKGSCTLTVDGKTMRMSAEEGFLLLPWQIHTINGADAEDMFIFTFSGNCIPCFDYLEFSELSSPYHPKKAIVQKIFDDLILKECSNPFTLFSCVNDLIGDYLYQRNNSETVATKTKENDLVPRTLSYMKEHFREELTLSAVAKNVGSNASYLSRILNENNGLGFLGYLNAFRFSHAETLLRNTDKTVMEIAAECGFGSVRSFNRIFVSRYHKTPTELRRQEKGSIK